jgi:hypothetical protein
MELEAQAHWQANLNDSLLTGSPARLRQLQTIKNQQPGSDRVRLPGPADSESELTQAATVCHCQSRLTGAASDPGVRSIRVRLTRS